MFFNQFHLNTNPIQEINKEFELNKQQLLESLDASKNDYEIIKQEREIEENQLEQLSQKLELVDCEIEEIKKFNVEEEFEIKEVYERKQSQIESRIRKLRQENSKYDQENVCTQSKKTK